MSSIVSISATWSPPAETVQGSSSAAIERRERISLRLAPILLGQAELVRDLLVGRSPVQFLLQLRDRPLDVAGACA